MEFPRRESTGVDCRLLLQRTFPTQGLKPLLVGLLHWQADSLLLHHLGSPQKTDLPFTKGESDGELIRRLGLAGTHMIYETTRTYSIVLGLIFSVL